METRGSCLPSQCGGQSASGCYCDAECEENGDCCGDKVAVCDSSVERNALIALFQANPENNLSWDLDNLDISGWEDVILEDGVVVGLSLYGYGLSVLPPEFGNLSNLQDLNLNGTRLSTLPVEFGNLSSLQKLQLEIYQLQSLPAEFGNLSSLQTLTLRAAMNSLPAEIGNLGSLQTLNLTSNELQSLPAEFGNLSSLQTLNITESLVELPASFGGLSNLSSLEELRLGEPTAKHPR